MKQFFLIIKNTNTDQQLAFELVDGKVVISGELDPVEALKIGKEAINPDMPAWPILDSETNSIGIYTLIYLQKHDLRESV